MNKFFVAVALLAAATAPLRAQANRQRDVIAASEMKEYGTTNLLEVVQQARPQFLEPDISNAGRGFSAVQNPFQILVYIGNQKRGDSTYLRTLDVREVEEVRYFRPGDANVRFGIDNAAVIQVKLKQPAKQ